LKALANRRRILIVRYLRVVKEAVVGGIADKIKLSFKSTSRFFTTSRFNLDVEGIRDGALSTEEGELGFTFIIILI